MSLSRSPSPSRGGGWSSPGLNTPYEDRSRRSSPMRMYPKSSSAVNGVSWDNAQARSRKVHGAFETQGQGPMGWIRGMMNGAEPNTYAEKEKLGRGRVHHDFSAKGGAPQDYAAYAGRLLMRFRKLLIPLLAIILILTTFYATPVHRLYRRHLAGGKKFVIILAANQGGGVMEWKGPRSWAIERDSVRNKKDYAKKWGYDLEVVDMSTKKKYAHEWRESWEKVDMIKTTMRKYPEAEWFWWLDLHTLIMEPTYSLQSHIFSSLVKNTYRDINLYNPLNITHPPSDDFLDEISRSANGDNLPSSIDMIVPQDCGGFNLGSFMIKRSVWSDRLLDMWWDPVGYEQKHMQWEHKEQDALEYMYTNQPWIRPHLAFIPQRRINSFPPGACGEKGDDPVIHYQERDRDFMVNMAGCEWGRDCWGEMYQYRQLSHKLNRNIFERTKDGISDFFSSREAKKKEEAKKKDSEEKRRDEEGDDKK